MLSSILLVIAGLVLLPLGAEGVVRGSTGLALRVGVTPLVIGLTVVALGTSSPELVVAVEAAITGNSGIVLGNVIGSNIGNIGLILGVSALVRPMAVRYELVRREVPVMIAVSLVLVAMLLDERITRVEGALLVLGAVAYIVVSYRQTRSAEDPSAAEEFQGAIDRPLQQPLAEAAILMAGLGGLIVGANLLVRGAVAIATTLGISPAVIGLTVVAIGTSLPELAAGVASSARGEPDVAFGNVVGSNIFNVLVVLGVAALIKPVEIGGVRALDVGLMFGASVLILPLMWRGWVLSRWEGALLLGGYVVYIASLVA
jgi:cation:H+ antiporter